MMTAALPSLLQQFFTGRLYTQIAASPNTIAGYRHSFRLLLKFANEQTGNAPTKLKIEDMDCLLVGDFLAHVETQRRNSALSRNARLAAIRSFFKFVVMQEPAYMLHCERILAMPGKRYVRRTIDCSSAYGAVPHPPPDWAAISRPRNALSTPARGRWRHSWRQASLHVNSHAAIQTARGGDGAGFPPHARPPFVYGPEYV
jgi:integrase